MYPEFYDVAEAWDRPVLESVMREKTANGMWITPTSTRNLKGKLFIFCSPHNPMGIVWSAEEIN